MGTITSAPQYINWNYTYLCNFSCSHCYSRSTEYPKELSTEQYKIIAKQIIDNNVFAVGFGGGEPVVRKDLLEIIEQLSKESIDTHLISNGWFLDISYLKKLKSIELGMLAISIDSPIKEHHDLFRLKKGSFDKAIISVKKYPPNEPLLLAIVYLL